MKLFKILFMLLLQKLPITRIIFNWWFSYKKWFFILRKDILFSHAISHFDLIFQMRCRLHGKCYKDWNSGPTVSSDKQSFIGIVAVRGLHWVDGGLLRDPRLLGFRCRGRSAGGRVHRNMRRCKTWQSSGWRRMWWQGTLVEQQWKWLMQILIQSKVPNILFANILQTMLQTQGKNRQFQRSIQPMWCPNSPMSILWSTPGTSYSQSFQLKTWRWKTLASWRMMATLWEWWGSFCTHNLLSKESAPVN